MTQYYCIAHYWEIEKIDNCWGKNGTGEKHPCFRNGKCRYLKTFPDFIDFKPIPKIHSINRTDLPQPPKTNGGSCIEE